MKSIQITIAAAVFASMFAGLSQASEISEFPLASASTVSRADVRAQAQAANKAGLLRYDFVGPVTMPSVEPMSHKTREELRGAAREHGGHDADRSADFVGGM